MFFWTAMSHQDLKKLVAPQSEGPLTDPISTDMIYQRRQAYHYQWWRPEDKSQDCHGRPLLTYCSALNIGCMPCSLG